jgi:hypothetical protein
MRYTTFILAVVLSVLPVAAARAQSQGTNGNGNICVPINGTAGSDILRSTTGVTNTSTTAFAEVFCPVNTLPVSGSSTTFVARVYSRNPAAVLTCTLYQLSADGTPVHQQQRAIVGSGGNPLMTLSWFLPVTAGGGSGGPGGSGGLIQAPNMVVDCTIPPVASGQVSAIASFGWQ